MRLGIMGGTFDPIHLGHTLIAQGAQAEAGLDHILFVPAGIPWLKAGRAISDGRHRLDMVRRAIGGSPFFGASTLELDRPGPTYTVDTLEELKCTMGQDTELFVILGLDALIQLPKWRQPQRVLELCTLIGVTRPGHSGSLSFLDDIKPGAREAIIMMSSLQLDISGGEIRRRVARGLSIRHWVSDGVADYIWQEGLYTSPCHTDPR